MMLCLPQLYSAGAAGQFADIGFFLWSIYLRCIFFWLLADISFSGLQAIRFMTVTKDITFSASDPPAL